MDNVLLSPVTRASLHNLVESEAHGILLMGDRGAGKSHIASLLTATILNLELHALGAHILLVKPEGKSISIETVRQVQQFLQLKTVGTRRIRRAVIIEDSESMTTEAQNALLKILEEPPLDTIIILTTSQPAFLRPTVLSRTQQLILHPATKEDSLSYFGSKGHKASDIEKAYLLSNGQAGLMHALLSGDEHPLVEQIERAKQLFGMSTYERLLTVELYSKNREELQGLLFACKRIALSAVEGSAIKNPHQTDAWLKRLKRIVHAEADMLSNPNGKLLLTDLFVNL